jgi:hypothetical protein
MLTLLACGAAARSRGSSRPFSAARTAACLNHRPEAHKPSPAAPGLDYREVSAVRTRHGNGVWVERDPHVPTLFMRFAPFRRPSSNESDSFAFAIASFFTNRKAESAYFHAAYRNAQEDTHILQAGSLVEQHRNVVLEWNSPRHHDYSRVVLGCLTP